MQNTTDQIEESASNSEAEDNLVEQEDEMEIDEEENVIENENDSDGAGPSDEKKEKKKKRGIIYLSSIPKFMNVTILREMLSEYDKIGRVYLQPAKLSGMLLYQNDIHPFHITPF